MMIFQFILLVLLTSKDNCKQAFKINSYCFQMAKLTEVIEFGSCVVIIPHIVQTLPDNSHVVHDGFATKHIFPNIIIT